MRTLCCFAVLAAVSLSFPARAADSVSELTERNIDTFIQETTDLTHSDNGMSEDEIRDFMDDHIYDHGVFRSNMTYQVPGQPSQQQQMGLNKKKFIQNVIEGRNVLKNYTSSTFVKDCDISADGQTAKIQTTSEESGLMPMPEEQMIPFEGNSDCTQHLRLSNKGEIVLISADCQTTFRFLEN